MEQPDSLLEPPHIYLMLGVIFLAGGALSPRLRTWEMMCQRTTSQRRTRSTPELN